MTFEFVRTYMHVRILYVLKEKPNLLNALNF